MVVRRFLSRRRFGGLRCSVSTQTDAADTCDSFDILHLFRPPSPADRREAIRLLRLKPLTLGTHSQIFPALISSSHPFDSDSFGLILDLASRRLHPACPTDFTKLVHKLAADLSSTHAWDYLHAVKDIGCPVPVGAFNALLAALARTREFPRMNSLFTEMKQAGFQPNVITYGILINHLSKSRRIDEALNLLDKMTTPDSDVPPDVVIFNTLIDGCCQVGRFNDALVLLERMRTRSFDDCEPNAVTYNCLIDAFCNVRNISMAEQLLGRMVKENIAPSVITLNAFVSGLCRNGKPGVALDFFRKKKGEWTELKGNVVTYSTLIGAFLHSNNVGKAMSLFNEMVDEGHSADSVTYFTMISGLAQAGRMNDASDILEMMKKAGCRPDLKCYNILINGFCKKKRLQDAHAVLQEMKAAGQQADVFTYNTLLSALCKLGDFFAVEKLLKEMTEEGCIPSVVTFGTLIHGYCKVGAHEDALKVFHSMAECSLQANTVIYNTLIDSFCKNKGINFALSLFDEMWEKGVPRNVTTYNALLRGLWERNMLDKAFELLNMMREERCKPNYVTVDVLSGWFAPIGEMERLKNLLSGGELTYNDGVKTKVIHVES